MSWRPFFGVSISQFCDAAKKFNVEHLAASWETFFITFKQSRSLPQLRPTFGQHQGDKKVGKIRPMF
jgi:hypothetical protein